MVEREKGGGVGRTVTHETALCGLLHRAHVWPPREVAQVEADGILQIQSGKFA